MYLSCIESFISHQTNGYTIGTGMIFQFLAPVFIPYIKLSSCYSIFIFLSSVLSINVCLVVFVLSLCHCIVYPNYINLFSLSMWYFQAFLITVWLYDNLSTFCFLVAFISLQLRGVEHDFRRQIHKCTSGIIDRSYMYYIICTTRFPVQLVRKDMDANEYEKLSNIIFQHKLN